MRSRLLVLNWKMFPPTLKEALLLARETKEHLRRLRATVVVMPPLVYLGTLSREFRGKKVVLGAQDVFYEKEGAYTGEVSTSMLASLGVTHVLIGHSERRQLGEGEDIVRKKLHAALGGGLRAILCVGEEERDPEGLYFERVREQVSSALRGLSSFSLRRLTIAYEPMWAIGESSSGAIAPDELHKMALYIRKIVSELHGGTEALRLPLLYGGSVDEENVEGLLASGTIHGLLVGRVGLDTARLKALAGKL